MTIKDLKKGDYFTFMSVQYPSENIVWVKGEYDRETKKYIVFKFNDVNKYRLVKGSQNVYQDFVF